MRQEADFDSRAFRNALGDFPTGVVIVTARTEDDRPLAITVSSFNAVSLDPPLVLFSIGKSNRGFPEWSGVEEFAISVLNEEQHDLSSKFGRSSHDKWKEADIVLEEGRMPVVQHALSVFNCSCFSRYDGGDHVIIVGLVNSISRSGDRKSPLIFFRGAYHSLVNPHPTWPAIDLHGFSEWHF